MRVLLDGMTSLVGHCANCGAGNPGSRALGSCHGLPSIIFNGGILPQLESQTRLRLRSNGKS